MIEVKGITKVFGNFMAVDGVSFSVEKGEVLGLLGPNGAGKTTAMRILTCYLPPTSGTASVAGYDIFEDSFEVRRHLGYLPELPPLYPEMTVESYLYFTSELRDVPRVKRKDRMNEVVLRTGLGDHQNRIIGTLSKGYRQRVGLAQAMIHDPQVLILDEPTAGLDPAQIIEIRNLIQDLSKDHTVILSTHILSEVSMTCKRVVIINEGRLVTVDTVANLENQGKMVTSYEIGLKPSGVDWKKAFDEIPGVRISNEEIQGNRVHFNLSLPDETAYEKVFSSVVSKGHIFTEIKPARASLEEVFLKLTKSDEARVEERRIVE